MKFLRKKWGAALLLLIAALSLGLFAGCGNRVTLSFQGATVGEISCERGEEVELPTPSRDGFAFDGWYATEDFSGERYEGTVVAPDRNTTYYAKWAEAYLLTLDAAGGSLATPFLYLKENANLLEAVEGLIPAKNGLSFGAWFLDGSELTANDRMPAAELTVTARYKAGYRVETYLQTLAGGYSRDPEIVYGSDYVGEELTLVPPARQHFTRTDRPADCVTSLTLREEEEQNLFKFYYDRNSYAVRYSANAPAGLGYTGLTSSSDVRYEGKVTLAECGFAVEGYRFAGWSTKREDEVEYAAGDSYSVTGDTTFYAVWDRGYTDRYGSGDLIFFPRGSETVAILSRGGHEFMGVRSGNRFEFRKENGAVMLKGCVFGMSFSYERQDLAGSYFFFLNSADPSISLDRQIDRTVTLEVDEYLNAALTQDGKREEGELRFDGEFGDYVFSAGDLSFHCLLGSVGANQVFACSGGEAGVYTDYWEIEGTGQGYSYGDVLFLDGYGSAALYRSISGYIIPFGGSYYVTGAFGSESAPMYKIMCTLVDSYGILTGQAGAQFSAFLYTVLLADGSGGYVFSDENYGEYSGAVDGKSATLFLDGFGIFDDSATLTVGGETFTGSYDISADYMTGRIVTVSAGGNDYVFRLASDYTFTEYTAEQSQEYDEYLLMGETLSFPLVVLYEEEEGDGKLAELYMTRDGGATTVLAAKGSYIEQALGSGYTLYSFTRTQAFNDYDDYVAHTLLFYTTEVLNFGEGTISSVYIVLEEDGEKYYDKITVEGEGEIWANNRLAIEGIGSLWIADGSVVEGSFSSVRSEYFGVYTGTFVYGSSSGNVTLKYELSEGDDGLIARATSFEETELYYLHYDAETGQSRYVVDLVLDGNGRAVWNDNYGSGAWQEASYDFFDFSEFGEEIYSLTIGPAVKFRFVTYLFTDAYGSSATVYSIYEEAHAGTYLSEEGETLTLDGFHLAEYAATGRLVRGEYLLRDDIVYFTEGDNSVLLFRLDEEQTFVPLDDAYGEWYLVDSSYQMVGNFIAFFDGNGVVTLSDPYGNSYTGYYEPIDADRGEYQLIVSLGKLDSVYGGSPYRAALRYFQGSNNYACILYNEAAAGVFVDDDWNVLRLDGYGGGSLYTADSGDLGEAEYLVIDGEKGFIDLAFASDSYGYGEELLLVIDSEAHTFRILDYSQYGKLYLSAEMDYIAFGADGYLAVGNRQGYYLVEGDVMTAYLYSYETEEFVKESYPAPTRGSVYNDGSADYYLWNGSSMTFEGTIKLLDREQKPYADRPEVSARISFLPQVGSNTDLAATFTVDRKVYREFTLNFYTNGELDPRVSYEGVDYSISFAYENKTRSFTVKAGYTEVTLQDYYDNFYESGSVCRGGKIVRETVGFGPILFDGPVFSGMFYYLYDAQKQPDALTFEHVSDYVVNSYRSGYGDGYEIVFSSGGARYAVDFFVYEQYYTLYSLYTYEEHTAGNYKVWVKYLAYTNIANTPGFGNLEGTQGKAVAATVFKQDGSAVKTLDCGILPDKNGVWLVEYDEKAQANVGKGYLVRFTKEGEKVRSVSVETYTFLQLRTLSGDYFVDCFTDGKGTVELLAIAYQDSISGSYYWVEEIEDVTRTEEDGAVVYTFRAVQDIETLNFSLTIRPTESGSFTLAVKTRAAEDKA